MKAIKSRSVLVLGGILIASLAAGCFGGDGGYSGYPDGNNGGYYSSNGGYYNSNPYGGSYYSTPYGYNRSYGNSYSYNNGYNGRGSYNAGYQNGVRADASRDRQQDRAADRHTVTTTTHDDRASAERQPSTVARDTHSTSTRESRSTHSTD